MFKKKEDARKKSVLEMRKLLFVLFLLIKLSHEVHDASFVKFCSNVGGALTKSNHVWDSGDSCKVTWPVPSSSKLEAKRYCKNWGAYPLKDWDVARENSQTECTYENVLECRNDYTLINGECYRFVEKNNFVTYKEAVKLCEKEKFKTDELKPITYKPQVIRFFDKSLIRWFRAYFTNLRSIFVLQDVQLNEIVSKDLGGTNFAIVYGMSVHYKSPPNSLVKLPKDARAQVMCSYKPVDTILSFGIKAKMIAPYYYPIATKGLVTVWRTSSHSSSMRSAESEGKLCQASLKAVIGDTQTEVFNPRKENSENLPEEFRKGFVISRSAVIRCCHPTNLENWKVFGQVFRGECKWNYMVRHVVNKEDSTHNCLELPGVNDEHYKWLKPSFDYTKENVETTFLYTAEPVDGKYDIVSRKVAVDAPLLCGLYIPKPNNPTAKDCPSGWTGVTRTAGEKAVCHRWFRKWQTYSQAVNFCKGFGGELSTFTGEGEFETIYDIRYDAYGIWVGMAIKDECKGVRYDDDQGGKCSKRNLWEFTGKITEDTAEARDFVAKTWGHSEPNNWKGWLNKANENCIELAQAKHLNDLKCGSESYTSCMIEAKKEQATEADCEEGWVPSTRTLSDGETVVMCYLMTNVCQDYWTGITHCRNVYDAHFPTFTNEKEFQLLVNLTWSRSSWAGYHFFLDYFKTDECAYKGVDDTMGGKCTKEEGWYSYFGGTEITPEVRKFVASKWAKDEPSGTGTPIVLDGLNDNRLFDVNLENTKAYAVCMKKAQKMSVEKKK